MYEAAGGDEKFYREGVFVNGAAQGYLIDKKTADQYKITNIAQLKNPKIAPNCSIPTATVKRI